MTHYQLFSDCLALALNFINQFPHSALSYAIAMSKASNGNEIAL
jgi:hypothetical protein